MMNEDNFTPNELKLIERLQNAPRPSLPPQRLAEIEAQLLQELPNSPLSGPSGGGNILPRPFNPWLIIVVIGVTAAVGLLLISIWSGDDIPPTEPLSPAIAATATSTTEQLQPTAAPTEAGATAAPTAPPTAAPNATPTLAVFEGGTPIVIIEGPVTAVNNNIITIFDIDIQVDANNPITTLIQIGDIIRIEGENSVQNGVIVIVAVDITIVHSTTIIINSGNNNNAPTLPSGCKVTGKGNIKCSKRSD